jgi:uncharacterized protein DUF927
MFTQQEDQVVRFYLGLLYDWSDEGSKLWKSCSWTWRDEKGDVQFSNYAAQSLDDLVKLISNRRDRNTDVYVCLGTQKLASTEKYAVDGFPKAIRQKGNIATLKCLALDLDVKPDAYATTEDAFLALDDFCRVSGMPAPTMEIQSGSGGLHVYWVFDKAVPWEYWEPLATRLQAAALNYGLKFDPQVTVNRVGILRVPETFNYKTGQPKPVFIYEQDDGACPIYSYQQLVGVLGAQAPKMHAIPKGSTFNPTRTANFAGGIETAPPVPIEQVAINCAVVNDILEREGNGDAEPLWNLALLAASFTTDPHDAAHKMSRGDPRYVAADTDRKLEQKRAARAANPQLGWPSCEQFSRLHPACATCPLFAAKKTPFHHVPSDKPSSDHDEVRPVGDSDFLPDGYWLNRQGYLYTLAVNPKTGEQFAVCVVNYAILDAGIEPKSEALLVQAMIGGVARWCEISVPTSTQPQTCGVALAKGGLYINPKNYAAARDLLVAWVAHLQKHKKFKQHGAYGWYEGGFAYDDRIFYSDRTESVYRGKAKEPSFTSHGELPPWQDAMQLVYGNLPLETIVASSFAAPLIELMGSNSLVLSIFSGASGVGKTTSMMLGQSVWGHPRTGMTALADTTNSTMKKVADLKSLPVYWDELRTRDQIDKVVDIVFQVTQGKGKQRLTRDVAQADSQAFTTMFVVASNHGIADAVYSQTESTEAGGLRVFEIEAHTMPSGMSDATARRKLVELSENYGIAGPMYAEFLARNRKMVKEMLSRVDEQLGVELKLQQKERFWWMTVAALLVGARLANHLGITRFDIVRLRAYLVEQLKKQRGGMGMQEYKTMQATQDVVAMIREMLHQLRNKHMIITERIPYKSIGKPTPNNLVDGDVSRMTNIWAQVGDQDGRIRLGARSFHQWLREKHLSPMQIIDALRAHYLVTQSKQTIGSGVPGLSAMATIGRFECYDLTPLPSGVTAPETPSPDSDEPS